MTDETTTTRENSFIEKRRERMLAAGVLPVDVRYARTSFVADGGELGAFSCALCDTPIRYAFQLAFERPGGAVIDPVGSDCIITWVRSMPASPERDTLLADITKLQKKLNNEKQEKKRREREAAMPLEARVRLYRDDWRRWSGATDGMIDRAGQDAFRAAQGLGSDDAGATQAAAEAREATRLARLQDRLLNVPTEADAALVARAIACPAAWSNPTVADMLRRLAQYGSFASDKARGYCERLVAAAERPAPAPAPAPAATPDCHACGRKMKLRQSRFGPFFGCTGYPTCTATRDAKDAPPPPPPAAPTPPAPRNGRTCSPTSPAWSKDANGRGGFEDERLMPAAPVSPPPAPADEEAALEQRIAAAEGRDASDAGMDEYGHIDAPF